MPAINVARTDTFEAQRQKINQIGDILSNISAGGSDLQTGNLKLGDGTTTIPSLSFISAATLGIYKPEESTIGFVSDGRKIIDFTQSSVYSYKDLYVQRRALDTPSNTITESGENYDTGSYTNISVTGGTGEGGEANITVDSFIGDINSQGSGYIPGTYNNIPVSGGNGSGTEVNFVVNALEANIFNAGSAYPPNTYAAVPLVTVTGSGSGATADIIVNGTTILNGGVTTGGSNYTQGSYPSVQVLNVPTSSYTVTTTSNGTPPPNNLYVIDGVTQDTLTLIKGNTYRFDLSDASVSGHPIAFKPNGTEGSLDNNNYVVVYGGTPGTTGAFVDLIIKPTAPNETIEYHCSVHNGMGSTISIVTGTSGNYGSGADAAVTVDAGGAVTDLTVDQSGFDYKNGDTVSINSFTAGGNDTGSGFVYTLSAPTYTSSITNVSVVDSGSGYVLGDALTANSANLGGSGSGFELLVNNTPSIIEEFEFGLKGDGYTVGDILSLESSVTNINATLNGSVSGLSTTLSVASTSVTVSDTTGIRQGMLVVTNEGSGGSGALAASTTVQNVLNSTTIELSTAPTVDGSAILDFSTTESSTDLSLSSVAGIRTNFIVEKVSGDGVLANGTSVISVDSTTNTIVLSESPQVPGDIVLNFLPVYGDPVDSFEFGITKLGSITSVTISDGGDGYSVDDQLSVSPSELTQPIRLSVSSIDVQELIITSSVSDTQLQPGDVVSTGFGQVVSVGVTSSTSIDPGGSYSGVSQSSTSGLGTGLTISFVRGLGGEVESVNIDTPGAFYAIGDTVTFPGASIGGTTPADNLVLNIGDSSIEISGEIYDRKVSGGTVDSVLIEFTGYDTTLTGAQTLYPEGSSSAFGNFTADGVVLTKFTIATVETNQLQITPDLTLYSGNKYVFDYTSISSAATFAFSTFPGGSYAPSVVENISTSLSTSSKQITVADTSNIVEGMTPEFISGTGALTEGTVVESVDNATTLTLSEFPSQTGAAVLSFEGIEYTDGVIRGTGEVEITISDNTPNLYYYSLISGGLGTVYNSDSSALLTVDLNNPKTFGSGFLLTVDDLSITDVMFIDVGEGKSTLIDVESTNLTTSNATVSTSLVAPNISGGTISLDAINSSGTSINVTSSTTKFTSGTFNVNDTLVIDGSSGNLETSGELKTVDRLNVNDITFITNNEISSGSGYGLALNPALNQIVSINSNTALSIPKGTTLERPSPPANNGDGYIRFNTTTNQYEGYSSTNAQWSSLGGVRDLDGNTTILAEETVGANDNTLWFINDNVNTVRFSKTHQEFVSAKRIRSVNTSAPTYVSWTANTPYGPGENVGVGDYVRYKTFIFEIIAAGTTASSGSEPIDTSGTNFTNGTATLKYITTSASTLVFEEISNLRIGENVPLTFDNDLKITKNSISSDVSDITIQPFTEKKVIINATSSLVIPVGDTNQKGAPSRGSIRYNTTDNQFEGYNGAQWGGLGGIKDVDQDTKIEAETGPGNDEDILYFFNAGNNTLKLTTSQLEFGTIDTIVSSDTDTLNINAATVTFDSLATTIDNTDSTISFITTSKDNLDFGLSTGLNNDHLLRLKETGDIVFNLGFGTGTPDNLTLLNDDLTNFELKHTRSSTSSIPLVRGSLNSGNSTIYSTSTESSAKVLLTAHNTTTGDKELVEYYVIDDGTDVYFTDYNNIKTGIELVSTVFDIDPSGNVRMTFTLDSGITIGDDITVTLIKTVIKR